MSKHTGPGAFLKNFIERNYGERALHHHLQRRVELYGEIEETTALAPALKLTGPEFEFDDED